MITVDHAGSVEYIQGQCTCTVYDTLHVESKKCVNILFILFCKIQYAVCTCSN